MRQSHPNPVANFLADRIKLSPVMAIAAAAVLPKNLLEYLKDFIRLLEFVQFEWSLLNVFIRATPVPNQAVLQVEERLRGALEDFFESSSSASRAVDAVWSSLSFCWSLFFNIALRKKGRLRLIIAAVRKFQPRAPRFRTGITQLDLKKIALGMDNSYSSWTDLAMMAVASRLLLRPSEVVSILLANVARDDDGYTFWIQRKKSPHGGWVAYQLRPSPTECVKTVDVLDIYFRHLFKI